MIDSAQALIYLGDNLYEGENNTICSHQVSAPVKIREFNAFVTMYSKLNSEKQYLINVRAGPMKGVKNAIV